MWCSLIKFVLIWGVQIFCLELCLIIKCLALCMTFLPYATQAPLPDKTELQIAISSDKACDYLRPACMQAKCMSSLILWKQTIARAVFLCTVAIIWNKEWCTLRWMLIWVPLPRASFSVSLLRANWPSALDSQSHCTSSLCLEITST